MGDPPNLKLITGLGGHSSLVSTSWWAYSQSNIDADFLGEGFVGLRFTDRSKRHYEEITLHAGLGVSGIHLDGLDSRHLLDEYVGKKLSLEGGMVNEYLGLDEHLGANVTLATKVGTKFLVAFPVQQKVDFGFGLRVFLQNTGTFKSEKMLKGATWPPQNVDQLLFVGKERWVNGDKPRMEVVPTIEIRYPSVSVANPTQADRSLIFYVGPKIDMFCLPDIKSDFRQCTPIPGKDLPNIKVDVGVEMGVQLLWGFPLPHRKRKSLSTSASEEKIWYPPENGDRYIGLVAQTKFKVAKEKIDLNEAVYFTFDQSKIDLHDSSTVEMFKKLADKIISHHLKIRIEGYASEEGSSAHNQVLSQKRAEAVRDYLIGIDPRLKDYIIEARGYGMIRGGTIEEQRIINRRVQFSIVGDAD